MICVDVTTQRLRTCRMFRKRKLQSAVGMLRAKLKQCISICVVTLMTCSFITRVFYIYFSPKSLSISTLSSTTASLSTNGSSWCLDNLNALLLKPGKVELAQYYLTQNRITRSTVEDTYFNFDQIKASVSYNVTSLVEDTCVAFFVHELRHGKSRGNKLVFAGSAQAHTPVSDGIAAQGNEPVLGGSAFHTVILGKSTIEFCPYVDHGNDTYTIFCPLYEPCVDVTSHMLFFDYLAFWPVTEFEHRPANVVAFNRRLCKPIGESTNSVTDPSPRTKSPFWIRKIPKTKSVESSSFDWSLQTDGRRVHPIGTKRFQKCRETLSYLHFMGDSHLNYTSVYAFNLDQSTGLQPGIVSNYHRLYIDKFMPSLEQVVRNLHATGKQSVVVANIGLHGICFIGLRDYVGNTLPNLVQGLRRMQDEGLFTNVKMIIADLCAKPPAARNYQRTANSVAIAAMNRLTADELLSAGLNMTFVEYFEIARPFLNETSQSHDHHYINVREGRKELNETARVAFGPVGIVIANYILNLACY